MRTAASVLAVAASCATAGAAALSMNGRGGRPHYTGDVRRQQLLSKQTRRGVSQPVAVPAVRSQGQASTLLTSNSNGRRVQGVKNGAKKALTKKERKQIKAQKKLQKVAAQIVLRQQAAAAAAHPESGEGPWSGEDWNPRGQAADWNSWGEYDADYDHYYGGYGAGGRGGAYDYNEEDYPEEEVNFLLPSSGMTAQQWKAIEAEALDLGVAAADLIAERSQSQSQSTVKWADIARQGAAQGARVAWTKPRPLLLKKPASPRGTFSENMLGTTASTDADFGFEKFEDLTGSLEDEDTQLMRSDYWQSGQVQPSPVRAPMPWNGQGDNGHLRANEPVHERDTVGTELLEGEEEGEGSLSGSWTKIGDWKVKGTKDAQDLEAERERLQAEIDEMAEGSPKSSSGSSSTSSDDERAAQETQGKEGSDEDIFGFEMVEGDGF